MANRRQWTTSALSAIACAALLTACGGGGSDELNVGQIVSFGDSLSDLGTYSPATSLAGAAGTPPFFAGRFTTNTHTGYTAASNTNTATVWVEWVAARVGVSITQAAVGFAATNIPCPAAASPALAKSCTGYGQGGSRVTNPDGVGKAQGALTVPVVTQVANHLARFSGFKSNDLVFLWAGNNDVFIQFASVAAGLPPATAIANVQTAGTELSALIKSQILANGAKRVAVVNLPDFAVLPAFAALPAPSKALLTQITAEFNTALTTGLAGANVRVIDARTLFGAVVSSPSTYGFVNVTTAACDPAKITAVTGGRVTDGSSLFCNAAAGQPFNTLRAGASATTWAFADGVHPSTGAHKVFGDFVITKIKDFGWVPPNL